MIAPTNHGGNGKHGGNGRAGPAPRERVPSERSMLKMRRFLAALRETGIIRSAAEASGIARRNHQFWCQEYPLYRRMAKRALRQAAEKLEVEARKRAIDGVVETTHTKRDAKGNVVAIHVTRRYSDRLMELLLKAHLPHEYRERTSVELSGKVQHEEMDHVRSMLADAGVRAALERARDRACLAARDSGDDGAGPHEPSAN